MPFLEQTMRWFGPRDVVTLRAIRQAGATGIVSALHHLSPGDVWSVEEIQAHKALIEEAGMRWSVVESVPVHESIKQRTGDFQKHIEAYKQSLRNLGACGISLVCYNFMAVTDWTRTNLRMQMPSGALALRFDAVDAAAFDLFVLRRPGSVEQYAQEVVQRAEERWSRLSDSVRDELARTILLGLPGTVKDLTPEEFVERLAEYDSIDSEGLRQNVIAFLKEVVPVAEEAGVVMALHPDDPPFPVFGLPRIAGTEGDLDRLFQAVPSVANGLTFCTGSLGAHPGNSLPKLVGKYADRIHFFHLRSVTREPDGSFFEDDHLSGSSSMIEVMRQAINVCESRNLAIPMRPDHGHAMDGDSNAHQAYPGYSYVGRLRGLAELRGLELGIRASLRSADL